MDLPDNPMRTEILEWIVRARGCESYLEIGLGDGVNFANVPAARKWCVDPEPAVRVADPVFEMTSDAFFAANTRRFDLIFIDGLHHRDVVFRDISHALGALRPGGIVVCHDMNPTTEDMQRVPRIQDEWTGDCWRAWLAVRESRDDLLMFVADADYGVGIVAPDSPRKTPRLRGRPSEIPYQEFAESRTPLLPLVPPSRIPELLAAPG